MAESGFPSLPTGANVSKSSSSTISSAEQPGRILNIPDDVRAQVAQERRPLRLQGEVVRVNDDNSVRVRTPRGDVDVQLPPPDAKRPAPQPGQRVEIEIQPPARQAPSSSTSVNTPSPSPSRPAPESAPQPQQVIVRAAPSRGAGSAQTAQGDDRASTLRRSDTPVNIRLRPEQAQTLPARAQTQDTRPPAQASTLQIQGFPDPGSLIRLEPLSAQAVQQVITQQTALPPDITAQVLPAAVQSSNIVVPSVSVSPAQPALIVQQPALTPLPTVQIQSGVDALQPSTPTLQTLGFPDASAFNALQPAPQNPLVSSALIPSATFQAPQVLQAAQLVNVEEGSFTPALANEAPSSPIPGATLDARITKIDAPLVQITPPQSTAQAQATTLPVSLFQSAPTEDGIPLPQTTNLASSVIQNQQAGQVSALVVGKTDYTLPVLVFFTPTAYSAFPAGVIPIYPSDEGFALTFPNENIPVGSQIHLTPQAPVISAVTALPLTGAPLQAYLMPQNWPVMEEIYQSLAQVAPPVAQGMSAHVPSPSVPAQFGAAALFFISAVRGGDIQSWLGDKAVEALRQSGKGGLLTRLGQEAGLLNRTSADPVGQDFRAVNLPMFWEGEMQKIALYFRHEQNAQGDDEQQGQKGTRFVFDLSLSAMGKVQVDGLFRPVSRDGPRLDVILRTQEHFSGAMQAEMRRMYTDALRPSQVGGELSFQNAGAQWVTIQADQERSVGVEA